MSDTTSVSGQASGDSGDLLDPANTMPAGIPISTYEGESPAAFSRRLYQYTVHHPTLRGRTAALLASRDIPYLHSALCAYVKRFRFKNYPIDMALRLFLAWERLPSEAQQVDRVLSAFAAAYITCNPETLDEQQAYLLSFSLILLHTSTFNPSVRVPMSKVDFLNMAAATEVPRVMLEYLFDNVTLVEFAHIYDASHSKRRSTMREQDAVYKLVVSGNLLQLQLGLESFETAACSAAQSMEECDMHVLHESVLSAPSVAMQAAKRPGGQIRLVKMGLVARRERNRWQTWGLVLTGAVLLWFRNAENIYELESQITYAQQHHLPCTFTLYPDEVTLLKDTICYEEGDVLCLDEPRRRLWINPSSERPAWLASINYIAALVTYGLLWDDTILAGACWQGTLLHASNKCLRVNSAMHPMTTDPVQVAERAVEQGEARRSALALDNAHKLHHARLYSILTPMQRATRDKLEQAQGELLHNLRSMHWELAVLACRLQVLTALI